MNSPTPDTVVVKMYWAKISAELLRAAEKQVEHYDTATHEVVSKETTARDEEMDEQVMKERDYAEEMVAKLVAEVLGDWPEWSSGYNFPDAFEDVADKLHAERNELTALRTRLATAERRLAAFDETVARGPVAWLLLNQGGLPDDRQDYEEVVLASATDESELAIFLKAGRADPLYALTPEASTDGNPTTNSPTKEWNMTQPTSIKIDNVEYIRKDSLAATEGDIKIAVLDRGFVYVGRVSYEGDFLILKSAKNIRVWGTSKGLGELVNGPVSGTKLDNVGTVRVPTRALISLIDVEQSKWTGI